MEFILENWAALLLILISAAGAITALTESKKDDSVVDLIKRVVNAIILGKPKK